MKLITTLLLLFTLNVNADSLTRCQLRLRPYGTFFNQCPHTMVAQGTEVYLNGSQFPQIRVRCAEPEIFCETTKKDLHKQTN